MTRPLAAVPLLLAVGAAGAADPAIEKKIDDLLAKMNAKAKIHFVCREYRAASKEAPRIDWGALELGEGNPCWADGGVGMSWGITKSGLAYPCGTCQSACWDEATFYALGEALASDARTLGVEVLLAPMINIYRHPHAGRNFETLGEDPYLVSRNTVNIIKGIQAGGICACPKVFVCNNMEIDRRNDSSEVDERTLREIYFPAQKAAVREADAAVIMSGYNRVNGIYCSHHAWLNNTVLRDEWGFGGINLSDWGGTHDGVKACKGGLDWEMPSPKHMNAATLLPALEKGLITEKMLDDKLRHILRILYRYGQIGPDRRYRRLPKRPPTTGPQNRPTALRIAREGITLLKNERDLLPLDAGKVKSLLVCGRRGRTYNGGGGSSSVHAERVVSTLDGLRQIVGGKVEIIHRDYAGLFRDDYDPEQVLKKGKGCFRCRDTRDWKTKPGLLAQFHAGEGIDGKPVFTTVVDEGVDWGDPSKWPAEVPDGVFTVHLIADATTCRGPVRLALRCTGKVRVWDSFHIHYRKNDSDPKVLDALRDNDNLFFTKVIDPHKNFRLQFCGVKGKARLQFGVEPQPPRQEQAWGVPEVDAAVVCVFREGGEGMDVPFTMSRAMEDLIRLVAAHVPNTTVVVFAGSSVAAAEWIDKVPSVVMGYYPGQEGGQAVAEILFGKVNPSGKLPFVWEKRVEDNPSHAYVKRIKEEGCAWHKVYYKEGVFIGYRGMEKAGVEPLFPFGHGLSYTTFEYADLKVDVEQETPEPSVKVSYTVKNTGKTAGAEATQLYVGDVECSVPRPVKELKRFRKVRLDPGERKKVELTLGASAFAFWHPGKKQWTVEPGRFTILVGSSSRDIRLEGRCDLR